MTTLPDSPLRRQLRHELAAIRGQWGWFLALGIALVVLGTLAIAVPLVMTISVIVFVGVLLLMAGIAEAVGSFWARDWSGFFLRLLEGIFYLILGFLFVTSPAEGAAAVTLVLVAFLIVVGIFRVVAALYYQFPGWGWPLASGLINILLGVLIWSMWPVSSLWVIGLFVGIEMILNGWWWIMIALGVRQIPKLG